jgi:hypothetical protein
MRTVTLAFVVLITAIGGIASAQQTEAPRDAQRMLATDVTSYSVRATNLLQAAAQISSDFGLPIGVEWSGDPASKKEIVREWHNTTLAQIVQDVATFDVEYQLEFSNGVVHLRKVSLADSPRNPLNIRISTFSTQDVYTRDAASQLSKQVSLLMFPREQEPRDACGGSSSAGAGEVRHSLSMKDAAVRGILDALLTRSDFAMWVVVFPDRQPETDYFQTESLWGNMTDPRHPDLNFVAQYLDPVSGTYRGDWKIGLRKP